MIKSVIYRLAQLAVLRDTELREEAKLEIVLELESKRSLAQWAEEAEARKEATRDEEV